MYINKTDWYWNSDIRCPIPSRYPSCTPKLAAPGIPKWLPISVLTRVWRCLTSAIVREPVFHFDVAVSLDIFSQPTLLSEDFVMKAFISCTGIIFTLVSPSVFRDIYSFWVVFQLNFNWVYTIRRQDWTQNYYPLKLTKQRFKTLS